MNTVRDTFLAGRQRLGKSMATTAAFAFALSALVVFTFAVSAFAQPASTDNGVTFVKVERHQPEPLCCNYSATDQPLTSDKYEYDVSLKQGCTIYTGRYERFDDYFPAYRPGQEVKADIDKHTMVLLTPSGERLKMPILDRTNVSDCGGK